jgi:hypothetical protein
VRESQEAVRFAAHGANDDDDVISCALRSKAAARDAFDAIDRPDGGPAKLLHQQRHGSALYASLEEKKGFVARPGPWF